MISIDTVSCRVPGLDAESGPYYLRARYYDPGTAQFLSRDPLVSKTMSPYAYVAGNPLNRTDPSGQGWCRVKGQSAACSTLPSSFSGPTKNCMVIGNGSTDVVTVEAEVSCHVLSTDGSRGPEYSSVDPSDFGATPANQTCSFDPGTGFSHCTTPPSETFNKAVETGASVGVDIAVACTVGGPIAAAVTVIDVVHIIWSWSH